MKNSFKIMALAAVMAIVPSACQKDFLTEVPADFVSPVNFYQNATDASAAVTAVYGSFINLNSPLSSNQYMQRNLWMLLEYPTEVATSRLSAANERSLIGNYNAQFNSQHTYLQGVWEAAYAGINRANSAIERIPKVNMDPVRRDQFVAEAKYLRALHYYYLAGLFGGVPLKLTETSAIDQANVARATAAETWAQIEKDLTDAAGLLPTAWGGTDYGRVTKGAALTLLGKVYLQSAATGGPTGDWQKGLDAFKTVMGLGYALDPSYASLFDGSNEKSKEIIFSFQNIRVDGAGGGLTQWFVPVTSPALYALSQQNQFQAERAFYDSYNPTDIRKDGTWMTSFVNAGKTVTWAWTSGIQSASNYGSTGPVPRKYVDLAGASTSGEAPDLVITRYADVLLSAAEASNEVSGPGGEAYGYINAVRARAKVPNLTAGLSQAAFRDSVFLERRFELAIEGHGLLDNRRNWAWSKARIEKSMSNISADNKSPFTSSTEKFDARPILDKWKLYPIPYRACQLNEKLVQNPGWEDGVCK
jgi:hypothetical protein